MRIACIALNSSLIHSNNQAKIVQYLNTKLYEIGEKISLISYFDNSLEKLRNIMLDNYDLIFIIGTTEPIYNHNIKDNIARLCGDKLLNNEACYVALNKYCSLNNIPFSVSEESEVMIPTNAIPLISNEIYHNGFMYKYNNKYLTYFPSDYDFVTNNYISYVLPLINDIIGIKQDYQVVKCFGILEKDIRNILSDYFGLENININIISDNLDSSIYIRYNTNSNLSFTQEIISNIISKLNKFIYSLEDVSIYEMASELLKIQRKSICIGETITSGHITNSIANINSKNINSANIFLNFDEMITNLNIDKKVIDQFGRYSVNVVYELANALLEKTSADNVLFVLGDRDNSEFSYIAVGDIDGIHVYKNKIIDSDNYFETLSKTAIFYLIKKLKQNSLQFE